MRIKPTDPANNKTMNNDIDQATAALKGMLGISSATSSCPARDGDQMKAIPIPAEKTKSKNKMQPKVKKKKSSNNYSSSPQRRNRESTPQTSERRNTNDYENKTNPNNNSNGGRNKTQSRGNKKGSKRRDNKNKVPEETKFAWSAFQSPPDASALPLPVFSSSSGRNGTSSSNGDLNQLPKILLSNTSGGSSRLKQKNESENHVDNPSIVKSVEELENEVMGNLKLNDRIPSPADDDKVEYKSSSSGVDLAALASPNAPITPKNTARSQDRDIGEKDDPLAVLMNVVNKSNSIDNKNSINPTPYQSMSENNPQIKHPRKNEQFLPPGHQPQMIPQMMNTSNTHLPMHQDMPHHATIYVQVPPVLLPGRQMMVQTPPNGFPVPVVVPENIKPGMVIPVNIPAPPPPPHYFQQHINPNLLYQHRSPHGTPSARTTAPQPLSPQNMMFQQNHSMQNNPREHPAPPQPSLPLPHYSKNHSN